MRYLPSSFVVHQWVIEANKLALAPISMSLDGRTMHLARPETVQAFNRMSTEAKMEGVKLKIIWAYRSANVQKQQLDEARIKHGKRGAMRWLAPPGYSEHQTGWAIDIGDENEPKADDNPNFEGTKAFGWLKRNAIKYGFELSFPVGNWQGVAYEPWHWRYIGTSEARSAFHPTGAGAYGIWGISFLKAFSCWILP